MADVALANDDDDDDAAAAAAAAVPSQAVVSTVKGPFLSWHLFWSHIKVNNFSLLRQRDLPKHTCETSAEPANTQSGSPATPDRAPDSRTATARRARNPGADRSADRSPSCEHGDRGRLARAAAEPLL